MAHKLFGGQHCSGESPSKARLASWIQSVQQIWSTTSLTPIYTIDPYLDTDSGDLFSLAWSPSLQTIYVGCQNTSLQWYDFNQMDSQPPTDSLPSSVSTTSSMASESGSATPTRKAHKFFDSYPRFERKPADIFANNGGGRSSRHGGASSPDSDHSSGAQGVHLQIPATNVIDAAHFGYIYTMTLLEATEAEGGVQLVTGSGDETIKVSPSREFSLCSISCVISYGAASPPRPF